MSRNYFAKRLARELGIPYAEALRRVQVAAGAEVSPMPQHLLAEVRRECWDMVGGKVAYRTDGGVVAGWHFDDLDLPSPPRIEQLCIHAVEVDYATLRWSPRDIVSAQQVAGHRVPGFQTGLLTVRSKVGFRCVMATANPLDDDTLHVLDDYVDETHVLVRLDRDVLLQWDVIAVDDQEPDLTWAHGVPCLPAAVADPAR